jgi:ubiquinone biosynthesis protein Coq4
LALARSTLREAARAGRAAAPLLAVYWERHWEEPLPALRVRLRIRPAASWQGLRGPG